jgi:hypothetical protein
LEYDARYAERCRSRLRDLVVADSAVDDGRVGIDPVRIAEMNDVEAGIPQLLRGNARNAGNASSVQDLDPADSPLIEIRGCVRIRPHIFCRHFRARAQPACKGNQESCSKGKDNGENQRLIMRCFLAPTCHVRPRP